MEIRNITPADREEVLSMMRVFYDSPALIIHAADQVLARDVDACISGSPYVEGYVFDQGDGTICGYSMLAKSFSTEAGGLCIWIEDLYLKPEYRGQGFGSALFRFVEEKYGDTAARLRLEVEPDNEKAIHVYEGMGYHELAYMQMIKDREY